MGKNRIFNKPEKENEAGLNTAVPAPFYSVGIWAVKDHKAAEKIAHTALNNVRSEFGTEHFLLCTELEYDEFIDEYGLHYQVPLDNASNLRDYIDNLLRRSGIENEYAYRYFPYM